MTPHRATQRTGKAKVPPQEGANPAAVRLIAAALLFLLCFAGKAAFPTQAEAYRQRLAALLSGSTDLHRAFSELGAKLGQREEVLEAVGDWCISVFAPNELSMPSENQTFSEQR